MNFHNVVFETSFGRFDQLPKSDLVEIAFAGRSNVGKSSMINSLLGNSKLARISSEPGKTRLVNFYRVNDQFWLVDLPGYGFAKAPKAERDKWGAMIEGYLEGSKHLKRVLHLVDIRHAPTREDQMRGDYLRHYDTPFPVGATKADKLSRAARGRSIPVICRTLAVQPWEVIPYSSEDGTGREKILELLENEIANGCEDDA